MLPSQPLQSFWRKSFLLLCVCSSLVLAHAQGIDIRVLRSLNPDQPMWADRPMLFTSNTLKPVCAAVPLGLTAAGLITHNKAMTRAGLVNAATFVTAIGITYGIKNTVKRTRPYVTWPDLRNGAVESSWSMPSGHTAGAFSTATALTLSYPRWYVAVPAYLWAGSVAYSRMHLGVHYPSDVLVGALIGTGCALLAHQLEQQWMK